MSEFKLPGEYTKDVVTRATGETDLSYGCSPHNRSLPQLLNYGLIILDKPANPTSHEVAAWVRQILECKKAGHGGTLDPAVTGVLPISLNRATRAVSVLLRAGKEYICILRLHDSVDEARVRKTVNKFLGSIFQRPPIKSSVKRVLRVRKIYYLECLEVIENRVLLRVGCEAGTYIRKLCYDIGVVLGVSGQMDELRRTKSGIFEESESVRLQDLLDAKLEYDETGKEEALRKLIRPFEDLFINYPKIIIRDLAVNALCYGAKLAVPGVLKLSKGIKKGTPVVVMSQKGEAVALATALKTTKSILESSSGLCAKIDSVFMPKDVYPKSW
ncbi:MAG: RNA-guided pseudouridylation complex pseudouridine synthase subunit Cbf5 [Candidatus Hodarchaeota archaeon]